MARNQTFAEVVIAGSYKKLSQATRGAAGEMKALGKKTELISKSMRSALGGIGLGLSIAGITSYLKEAVNGAELARQADQRVSSIAATIGVFGKTLPTVTKHMRDYADQVEITTGVTAEEIKAGQAKLLTYASIAKSAGKTGGIFERANAAAMDLAAAGFGSISTNADTLGKALANPLKGLTALERQGFTYSKSQKKQFAVWISQGKLLKVQKFLLGDIESQVKGTAAATGKSTDKIKNAFGQVSDAIGGELLPYIDKFAKFLNSTEGKKAIQDTIEEVKKLAKEAAVLAKWAYDNKELLIGIGVALKGWQITSGIITSWKTLAGIWKGMKKNTPGLPNVEIPGATKIPGKSIPVGTQIPGGKTQYKKPIGPIAPSNKISPNVGRATGLAALAATILAMPGSSMVQTPQMKGERLRALSKDARFAAQPGFGNGDLLRTGAKQQTGPVTINIYGVVSGNDVLKSLKRIAQTRGITLRQLMN